MEQHDVQLGDENRLASQAKHILGELRKKFETAKKERFVFLLVGRTGVGKSSTVNSLMGMQIAKVGDWEPTTFSVESYESEAFGIRFEVIDTPGLCDDIEEAGNDDKYLDLIRNKIKTFDCMWFVTRLNETRVTADEKRGIQLISEAFGKDVWKHAVIVFTFANADPQKYALALEKRGELIRKEIAKYAPASIADGVPSVAVDNTNSTTPDGQEWLGELYTKVFTRMSDRGLTAFYLATADRVVLDGKRAAKRRVHQAASGTSSSSASSSSGTASEASARGDEIRLNERQSREVKKRIDASIIGGLALAGAGIGAALGPAGAVAGGAIGAAVGLIAWLWD